MGRGAVDGRGAVTSGSPVRRVGIYDAYLHTLGGGENLLAVLAACLERELPGAEIELLTHEEGPATVEPLVERFGVRLERTRVRCVRMRPRRHLRRLYLLRRLLHERDVARLSIDYDLFVNGTIFSMVPPRSRHSLYLCMFPLDPVPAALVRAGRLRRLAALPYLFVRRLAIHRFVRRYDRVVSISEFTRGWVRELWGLDSQVLYPPVQTCPVLELAAKRKRVLAIGRFFPGDHNKKHDVLIEAFGRLCRQGLEGWELHLAGGRTPVDGTDEYLCKLRRMAEGLPVRLHVDAGGDHLRRLLATSSLFWHATGFGEDERRNPYRLEHFGISTVEAMSYGCVPLVYAAGGQPEVVEDGVSGFLWCEPSTLIDRTRSLIADEAARERMAHAAHLRSRRFGRDAFAARVHQLLADLLPAEPAGAVSR